MSAGSFEANEGIIHFVETSRRHEAVHEGNKRCKITAIFVQFRRLSASSAASHVSAAIRTLVCFSTLVLGDYCPATLAQSTDPASGTQQVEIIHYRSHTYAVPRDYIVGLAKGLDFDKARSFFVEFGLPRFEPRGDPRLHSPTERGWRDQVFALYKMDTQYRKASELFAEDLKRAKEDSSDFVHIAPNLKKYTGNFVFSSEMYVYDDGRQGIYAWCDAPGEFPSPSCRISYQIYNEIAVDYSFSRNYINDIKSINDKIEQIIHRID